MRRDATRAEIARWKKADPGLKKVVLTDEFVSDTIRSGFNKQLCFDPVFGVMFLLRRFKKD
jgi:hypothetical protein